MIRQATPAEDEKACIGTETRPRASGHCRRHHSERQSVAPPITSNTSRGPSNPRPTWSASAKAPIPVASRNSVPSTIQSRCERRKGILVGGDEQGGQETVSAHWVKRRRRDHR